MKTVHSKGKCRERAFTLIEILVVIGIIAILASLLLSSVMRGKGSAQKTACLNNQKQLITTWIQYSTDHDDDLVANHWWRVRGRRQIPWVTGAGHPNTAAMTNIDFLLDDKYAAFAPYIGVAGVYQCPSTRERVDGYEAIRSYSVNQFMGAPQRYIFNSMQGTNFTYFQTQADIPTPSDLFVFADINQKFICFPMMILYMDRDAWHHPPASHHNHGGTLAFADGHVEYHKWREHSTVGISTHTRWNSGPHVTPLQAGNQDLAWVREHATVPLSR
jgi:prepilin-type N-terminal cleavage/methylation domain-containing protein/prepilin-type processing-associated H-X9-DG protein